MADGVWRMAYGVWRMAYGVVVWGVWGWGELLVCSFDTHYEVSTSKV